MTCAIFSSVTPGAWNVLQYANVFSKTLRRARAVRTLERGAVRRGRWGWRNSAGTGGRSGSGRGDGAPRLRGGVLLPLLALLAHLHLQQHRHLRHGEGNCALEVCAAGQDGGMAPDGVVTLPDCYGT